LLTTTKYVRREDVQDAELQPGPAQRRSKPGELAGRQRLFRLLDQKHRQDNAPPVDHISPVAAGCRLQPRQHPLDPDHRRHSVYDILPTRNIPIDEIQDDGIGPRRGNVSINEPRLRGPLLILLAAGIRYATVLIVFVSGTSNIGSQ